MEKTLVFFKPDAIERNIVDTIFVEFIFKNGFDVIRIKPMLVTKDLITEHYKDNLKDKSEEIVRRVVDFYDGKWILLLILQRENAIKKMREILGDSDPITSGPETIRGKFGDDSYELAENEKRSCRNIMHAADSQESFQYEFSIWFKKVV